MNIPTLSGNEKILFILITYTHGHYLTWDDVTSLLKKEMSEMVIRRGISALASRKLIIEKGGNYYYGKSYELADGRLIPAIKYCMQPENEDDFNKVRSIVAKSKKYKVATDVVYYVMSLINPKYDGTTHYLPFPTRSDLIYELKSVFIDKEYREIFRAIPDSALKQCVQSVLEDLLDYDLNANWEYFRQIVIEDRRTRRRTAATAELLSSFNLYYYLGTGEMCIDLKNAQADVYALATAAISLLYKGDYQSAYKLYTKAMTAHNKDTRNKGVFDCFVVNYYYILCQLLCGEEKNFKKLDNFIKKIYKYPYPSILVYFALYDYFRLHSNIEIPKKDIKDVIENYSDTGMTWLPWMIYKRLEYWPENTKEPSLTNNPPHAAWLRAELMPTGVIPLNDEAAKNFGDSLFYRLKVKPIWELRLETIIKDNTPQQGKTEVDQRDSRLIYLLEFSQIIPILQKRLKSGEWSTGRRLSASSLKRLTDKDAHLDEVDQRLIRNISDWDYSIYESNNIYYLVGCDHVYTGSQTNPMPVNIHEEKPCLIIDKEKDGSFSVTTNVDDLKKRDSNKAVVYKKNSETDYSVYHPTALERKVYQEILAQKVYPKEAEPLLMKLIATLGGKTEIHSNMVVDLDDLEKVEGETKLTLRCVPDRYDTYNISVSVHVFPGLIFVPGEGNVMTVAEKDGKKVQIVRHMKTERKNMKQLSLKLNDLGVIDDDDNWEPKSITDSITLGIGMFLELIQWVKDNPDICEMEWPEGAKIKYHPAVKASAASIGFKAKNGWFDVEGDVQISEEEVISLQKLLEMMHESGRRRYIKIGENEYITLSSDLSKILKRLDTVTSEHRNHLQMSSAAVGLIGDVLDNPDAKIAHSKAMDELRKRIADSANVQPVVPKALHATMRDYQEEGYDWMERVTSWGAGVCLADDMGLGKTLQTIAMLLDKEADGASLVVAPASVVPNWRNELKRFAPTLRVTILNEAEDRNEAIKEADAGDIVVSTYALMNNCQEQLAKKEWNVICLDEAHTIKNPNTKMSKAAMSLQGKRKVILTGTPIQNHLSELWNLFQFINPGLLGSADQFGKKFIEPIEGKHDKDRQNQLRRLISPFLLRRTKGEVIEELPEKNEITIPVELSSDEMTMYEVRRREAEKSVLADKTVKISTLAEITKLRQMACSVSLVDKKWKRPSSKVLAFIDLAESLNDSGNRALVFSQFTSFFDQIRAAMDKAKLPYLYLDGSTPMAQREKLVKEFQSGKCPFFLISLKAGGLGLNLTGANYVIHLDPWWNPAIEQQATDRAYRIGQKQDVTVYHLISQHTIEEKIQRLHKTKRDLADSLLEGTDMSHALTQEELLELLK